MAFYNSTLHIVFVPFCCKFCSTTIANSQRLRIAVKKPHGWNFLKTISYSGDQPYIRFRFHWPPPLSVSRENSRRGNFWTRRAQSKANFWMRIHANSGSVWGRSKLFREGGGLGKYFPVDWFRLSLLQEMRYFMESVCLQFGGKQKKAYCMPVSVVLCLICFTQILLGKLVFATFLCC